MSKLDDILKNAKGIIVSPDKGDWHYATDALQDKQQIKDLILELIGGHREWNTSEPYDNPDMAQGYNEAIDEIREKVEAL